LIVDGLFEGDLDALVCGPGLGRSMYATGNPGFSSAVPAMC
jgi:hypothetical protein